MPRESEGGQGWSAEQAENRFIKRWIKLKAPRPPARWQAAIAERNRLLAAATDFDLFCLAVYWYEIREFEIEGVAQSLDDLKLRAFRMREEVRRLLNEGAEAGAESLESRATRAFTEELDRLKTPLANLDFERWVRNQSRALGIEVHAKNNPANKRACQ